jgi:hypothetical protein
MAKTLEQFMSEAQVEVDAAKPMMKSVNGNRRELNDAEYAQKVIDIANYNFDKQENGYKEARQEAYGSWQQQMDMMYWDNVNGTTNWQDHIAQVKSDNPKPS